MNSTTKQFAWKDRDTVAYDLLQLVYHAPPYISRLACRLLGSIRSPLILSQLKVLFLDEQQQPWHRTYAMRALIKTRGNILFSELEDITREAILNPDNNIRYSGDNFWAEILKLADKHPINREWVFNAVSNIKNPERQLEVLLSTIYRKYTDDFHKVLINQTLTVLDNNPHLIDLKVINSLTLHTEYCQHWLDNHIYQIAKLCIAEVGSREFRLIIRKWSQLADLLRQQVDNFDEIVAFPYERNGIERQKREEKATKALQSPAYKYLQQKYLAASDGDAHALYNLTQITRQWLKNIPFRAVAVHFIGKLYQQYDVTYTLYRQVRYGNDDWGDEYIPDSPVRYEAGEALLKIPTPDTWESLVDGYFISPRDTLLGFQTEWIAYITDVLSGDTKKAYDSVHYAEPPNRPWFRALADISEEELQELTKNIR